MRGSTSHVTVALQISLIVALANCVFCALPIRAQSSNAFLPFQGQLTTQSGEPISAAKPLTLVFRLYENPVGGVALWEEVQANILVIAGRFNVLLGSRTPFSDLKVFNR